MYNVYDNVADQLFYWLFISTHSGSSSVLTQAGSTRAWQTGTRVWQVALDLGKLALDLGLDSRLRNNVSVT